MRNECRNASREFSHRLLAITKFMIAIHDESLLSLPAHLALVKVCPKLLLTLLMFFS